MKKQMHWVRTLVAGLALAASLPSAMATVLTFDDLDDGLVPLNYGGLDWSSAGWTVFSTPAAPYTAHSGNGRVTNDFMANDASSTIRFANAAVFDGAYFSGLGGAVLSFQLMLNGQTIFTSASLDPSATPTFLASGYAGLVDAVVVTSANHGEFVMDDFKFTQPVPEPETYALLLPGLLIVGGMFRRRKSHA